MTITKQELADGIRFAGRRAAAAAENVVDWDRQLAHEWTTADAFRHVAATAGGLKGFLPLLDDDRTSSMPAAVIAKGNADRIASMAELGRAELIAMIREGHEASAEFALTLDDADLERVVKLGGYEMPKDEIIAQIWNPPRHRPRLRGNGAVAPLTGSARAYSIVRLTTSE